MPISTYNIPSSSLGKVRRFYEMKKAAGQKVQPWEIEAAMSAEFDSSNRQNMANRSFDMAQAQNEENNRIRREEIEGNKSGQNKAAIGNILTTGATLNYLMKDPNVVDASGKIITQGQTPLGKGFGYLKEGAGKVYDKVTGAPVTTAEVVPTTTAPTLPTEGLQFQGTPGSMYPETIQFQGTPGSMYATENIIPTAYNAETVAMMGETAPAGDSAIAIGEQAYQAALAEGATVAEATQAGYAAMEAATSAAPVGSALADTGMLMGEASAADIAASSAAADTAIAGEGAWGMAGGTGAAPAGVYAGPAVAGYAAPKIIDAIHGDSMENLGHNATLGLISNEKTAKTVGGGLAGAGAGALTGAAMTSWSGPGAIVGAAIGAIAGALGSSDCIIVTACTHANSEEVNVTREYREKFLTPVDLRGYYLIGEMVVPWIKRFPAVKWIVKRILVDSLISYGRYKLYGKKKPGILPTMITKGFLTLCRTIGSRRASYVRLNGEVI